MENPFEQIINRLARIENLLENLNRLPTKLNGNTTPNLMSTEQLSVYLSLSKSAIYKLTYTKKIPHYKRGKKLYFDKEDINKWIFEGKQLTEDEMERVAQRYTVKKRA